MTQTNTISDLIASPEFSSLTNSQKAIKLYQSYHFTQHQILQASVCTRQSFGRALQACSSGRDAGRSGHPKDLSDRDEDILCHWISDLIDQGEIVYSWKLVLLVCS